MKEKDKELLFKDLCARLPYGVKLRYVEDLVVKKEPHTITLNNIYLEHIINGDADIKPYLRPMSSMTDKEKAELKFLTTQDLSEFAGHITNGHGLSRDGLYMFDKLRQLDFCLSHHFDYRGLIEKCLALEAPEGMYKL